MNSNALAVAAVAGLAFYAWSTMARTPPAVEANGGGSSAVVVVSGAGNKPRGIRNNNPGNVKFNPVNKWLGQKGQDAGGFCVFDTPAHGLRCMAKLLHTYYTKYGLKSVAAITRKWSPDANGLSGLYAGSVAKFTGLDANATLIWDAATITKLMRGMIAVENGAAYLNYYSAAALAQAVSEA